MIELLMDIARTGGLVVLIGFAVTRWREIITYGRAWRFLLVGALCLLLVSGVVDIVSHTDHVFHSTDTILGGGDVHVHLFSALLGMVLLVAGTGAAFGIVVKERAVIREKTGVSEVELNRTKSELEETQSRFRDFANATGDRFWETDTRNRFTYISPCTDVLTTEVEAFLGKCQWELPDRVPEGGTWQPLQDAMAKHEPFRDFRFVWHQPGEPTRHISASGIPVFGVKGEFKGYRGSAVDQTELVSARAEVDKLNQQFAAILEQFPEPVFLYDKDNLLQFSNSAAEGCYNFDLRLGMPYREVIEAYANSLVEHDENARAELVARTLEKFERRERFTEIHMANGRWMEIRRYPTADGGMLIIWRDATDQKLTELALRESERRFRDIASASGDRLMEWDTEFRHTWVSDPQGRLSIPTSELLGRRPWEVPNRIPMDGSWDDLKAKVSVRKAFRDFRYTWRRPGVPEAHFKVSGVPVFDENGTFTGYRGASADETDQVIAERNAADTKERFFDTLEQLPVAVVLVDSDDRIVFFNSQAQAEYDGHPFQLEIGMHASLGVAAAAKYLYQPEADQGEAELVSKIDSHYETALSSNEQLCRDGRWLLVTRFRTRDGGMFIMRTDVTEQKRAEQGMQAALQQAQMADRAKSEFLANMSHELRTPLNAVIGFADALGHDLFGPMANDRQREYIRNIQESGEHLLELINDILDVSAVEAGHLELQESEFAIIDVAAAAIRLVSQRAMKKQIEIRTEFLSEDLRIRADIRRAKQILVNILSNAVKFTSAGGEVRVASVANDDGSLTITIADNGIGMNAEDIRRALTRFGKVTSNLETIEGTGLGLPLASDLMEAHGGHLWLDSTPDQGTTVRLWLPAERVVTGTSAPALDVPATAQAS